MVTVPLAQIERLNTLIRRTLDRVAELEDELARAWSERDHMAQRAFDLEQEVRGYQWGLSNANAEEQALREWGPDD